MRFYFCAAAAAAAFFPAVLSAQADIYGERHERLDSIVVSATRAGERTPVTYTSISKADLVAASPMSSLPMALSLQPSVVVTNEGGTGLGYSKMTVRGVKGSQINVTLNGITLNDAESQEVFWVNIPALTNLLSSVQLQRGLGTSANGSGAFGASVNMGTAFVGADPTVHLDVSGGAWNTLTATVSASTGLLPGGFHASGAFSRGRTDGYLRNAWAKVQSAYAAVGWIGGNNSLRFTYLLGDQHTGITWNGLPLSKWEAGEDTYNSAGEYYDAYGNVHYYQNESDNYTQQHFQLNWTHRFSDALAWSTTANYTKGYGWYDQLKAGKKFSKYGMASPQTGLDGESYTKADFTVKKFMDNSLIVLNSGLRYTGKRLRAGAGLYASNYRGDHFGNVVWVSVLGEQDLPSWYYNIGVKREVTASANAEYALSGHLSAYADLQYRMVFLNMKGEDDDNIDIGYMQNWFFFNPRGGITGVWGPHKAYASVALGHREPGRPDLKENIKDGKWRTILPESMVDIEAGYVFSGERISAGANLYLMEYRNMLLETGRISSVGNAIKENVPRSWRRGVELTASAQPSGVFRMDANMTLSLNQIADYTAYFEDWDSGGYREEHIGKTSMLMSPSVLFGGRFTLTPFTGGALKPLGITLGAKYVGSQYWDNTMSADRKLPAYFTTDLSVSHTFSVGNDGGRIGVALYIDNLLNSRYCTDVWVYRAWDGASWYQEEGLTPRAPRSGMLRITYDF